VTLLFVLHCIEGVLHVLYRCGNLKMQNITIIQAQINPKIKLLDDD